MSTATPLVVDPVRIGPTWQRDPDHPSGWLLPDLTLGWHIAGWTNRWLQHSDGEGWRYTPEQLRFMLWWYAVDDRLRFRFRDGVLQRLKGWGKDPVGATFCAVEFVGPSRPDPSGATVKDPWGNDHPAGVAHSEAWVQTAAVSKDQTRNTMTLFPSLFSKAAVAEFEVDLGKEIIYAHRGAQRIEAVTSSPRALEGARSTFVLRNEPHHWLSNNEGHEMDAVIDRNLTKSSDGSARALSITNAYQPGEDSVAERTRDAWEAIQAGRSVDVGMLYDSLEAPPDAGLNAEEAPAVIEAIRGDSTWLDIDRIVQAILDKRNPPSRSRRFWYNQITASEDSWVAPQEWDRLADATLVLADNDIITLGFDGSKSDDHCALVACRVEDGAWFTIGVWDPGKYDGEAPRGLIDGTVRRTFDRYDVVGFFSDLHPWESYVDAWADDFGRDLCVKASTKHPVAWDMRSRTKDFTSQGAERLHDEIVEQAFRHDGDPQTRLHVHNARRRPNQWGVSFGKEHRESSRKIDSLPAGVLARMARRAYLALPSSKQRRQRSGRASFV